MLMDDNKGEPTFQMKRHFAEEKEVVVVIKNVEQSQKNMDPDPRNKICALYEALVSLMTNDTKLKNLHFNYYDCF